MFELTSILTVGGVITLILTFVVFGYLLWWVAHKINRKNKGAYKKRAKEFRSSKTVDSGSNA
ncbi:MAG TPA: hypothetical protein DDY13_07505 [Cytophagales bacterium]|jgi:hypothetical protein|nr:hypothetical protein [Cytophagales bacterium]